MSPHPISQTSATDALPLLVIAGPTGIGKSEVATKVAGKLDGEIINFDSVQVYEGFDIGSAKPPAEQRALVPHHLFDIVSADEDFDAAAHADAAARVIEEITDRGRVPILVGGTNFYLRALLKGLPPLPPRDDELRSRLQRTLSRPRGREALHRWLRRVDPESAESIPAADSHRLIRALEVWMTERKPISEFDAPTSGTPARYDAVRIALEMERDQLRERIHERVERMFRHGLIEETKSLLSSSPPEAKPLAAIGYREAVEHLVEGLPLESAIERTKNRTWQFARRQISWLRGEQDVHRVRSHGDPDLAAEAIVEIYRSRLQRSS